MDKWISVKDKLPEDKNKLLIFESDNIEIGRYNPSKKRFELFELDYFGGMDWCKDEYVTHWMPLPEPPKGKECV